ncbi:NUDIX hydrolase [Flagellimonas sediminis]|uniref:NUDIX hydrolase n=1 Tax=Flagellimonas sediminis TaxID=2696468 RepID=UPI0028BD2AA1|nr:NUDIX domain-containing protein [Allomuricauda sediminis]
MLRSKYDPQQRITVAVDCIIFGFDSEKLKLLLFRRKVEPFKGSWSLIGALIKNDVSLDQGASEILYRLTGLRDVYLKQLKTYGAVNRDPVERVISVAYYSLIRINEFDLKAVEDHDARWFDLKDVPDLLLDHGRMVQDAIRSLRLMARNRPLGFELLPQLFTLPQLQILYESIYDTKFDPRNFRKKILSLNILEKTDTKDMSGSKRGAFLYRFRKNSLDGSSMSNGEFEKLKEVIQF